MGLFSGGNVTDMMEGRVVEVDGESHEGTVVDDEVEPHFIVKDLNNIIIIK